MKIGIYGTGAYAIALASAIIKNNHDITMWTRFDTERDILIENHKNIKAFPNYEIDSRIKFTSSLEEVSCGKDLLIIAIPTPYVRNLLKDAASFIDANCNILIASKGIEQGSNMFINEIVSLYVPGANIGVISGPTFAVDIVNNNYVGLSLATLSDDVEKVCVQALCGDKVSLVRNCDVVGTELCGAVKNVFAIGSGILNGLGVSDSTIAMYLTQVSNDMKSLILKINGDSLTAYTLAGIGDLILTCTSVKSRNYSYGFKLATMDRCDVDKYASDTTIEGINSLIGMLEFLGDDNDIEIFNILSDIIFNKKDADELLKYFK